ncbi:hypothetical protein [Streptomyces sp. NPDC026673]|uniref:hypothetical protein n=1 Tax=Streptomyces sp. NPDC026673 TaxID=3155724 RepID=UPI0034063C1C
MNPTHEHHDTDGTDTTDGTGTATGTGREVRTGPAEAPDGRTPDERTSPAAGTGREPRSPQAPETTGKGRNGEPPAARRPAGWSRPEEPAEPATAEEPRDAERPAAARLPARDGRVPAPGAPPRVDGAVDKLQQRLQHAVGGFVDEPRHAVEEADEVLGEATDRLVEELRGRRDELRSGWRAGGHDDTDTERLRVALRGYRDLVDRVLQV